MVAVTVNVQNVNICQRAARRFTHNTHTLYKQQLVYFARETSCARGDTICPAPLLPVGAPAPRAPPSRRNVAVLSHAEYFPTLTAAAALRVKAALSKVAW